MQDYRSGHPGSGAVLSTAAGGLGALWGSPYRIGKITSVVTSDDTHGPHLVVKPQAFSGRPPLACNSDLPALLAYPTPNLRVESYQVGEYVAVWTAEGARLAVKLGAEGGTARKREVRRVARYWGELEEPPGRGPDVDPYVRGKAYGGGG